MDVTLKRGGGWKQFQLSSLLDKHTENVCAVML